MMEEMTMSKQDLTAKPADLLKGTTNTGDQTQQLTKDKVEAPPIEDAISRANVAIAQAQKAKQKRLKAIKCTDCGGTNIQVRCECIIAASVDHFKVCLDEDDIYVNPNTGEPITNPVYVHILKCKRGGRTGRVA